MNKHDFKFRIIEIIRQIINYTNLAIVIITTLSLTFLILHIDNEMVSVNFKQEMISIGISIIISVILVIISNLISDYRQLKESHEYYNNLRKKILLHPNESNKQNNDNNPNQLPSGTILNDNRDIIELMIANMKEINEYYVLSKKMTRQSFLLAVCMCIGGFFIISTAVAFILVNNLDAKEAIIPVISGAVIEAIAATTLIVYKKSLEQLNRYYDALHNNEIFLSSVNLVSKISTERRDQMYEYIIKTKLEDKSKQNNTEGQ